MTDGDIIALFAPFGAVTVRRMFGGRGIYADGLCFALEVGAEIFLKVDDQTIETFRAAGSRPFSYQRGNKMAEMSYWLLAEAAFDDESELVSWSRLGLEAARRAAARKAPKKAGSATAKSRKAGSRAAPATKRPAK